MNYFVLLKLCLTFCFARNCHNSDVLFFFTLIAVAELFRTRILDIFKMINQNISICQAESKKVSQPAVLLKPPENVNGQNTKWLSTGERWVSMCVCANVDQWRPPTWASRFLHSWVCCWCCCKAALACLSRLFTSR